MLDKETERLRRLRLQALHAKEEALLQQIAKLSVEQRIEFMARVQGQNPDLARQLNNRLTNTAFGRKRGPGILDQPIPITAPQPTPRRRPFLEFYTRIFGKAGTNGVHGNDDHRLLPDSGAAISGGTAERLPAREEPDAGGDDQG